MVTGSSGGGGATFMGASFGASKAASTTTTERSKSACRMHFSSLLSFLRREPLELKGRWCSIPWRANRAISRRHSTALMSHCLRSAAWGGLWLPLLAWTRGLVASSPHAGFKSQDYNRYLPRPIRSDRPEQVLNQFPRNSPTLRGRFAACSWPKRRESADGRCLGVENPSKNWWAL